MAPKQFAQQKRELECIEFSNEANKNISTNTNYHKLKILTVDHQLQVQLSSLMWDYNHNTLPA